MKKILFVAAHRPDRSASQRFRFEQYFTFLERNGYKCEISYLLSAKDDRIFYARGQYFGKAFILLKSIFKRVKDVFRANQYDLIFIQREAFMLGTSFFERRLSKSKAKLIFDFDDAIWINQQTDASANKNFLWLKRPSKTSEIIEVADLVFAGNRYLMDYALRFNPNTVIIPTTLDTEKYKPSPSQKQTGTVCIGWSGSHTTIEHFTFILPVLRRLKKIFQDKIEFKVVGDKNFAVKDLELQGISWNLEGEITELSTFDIGIMPLPDEPWTKGKCGFKGLLYMSMGIPAVMSPVGVNSEIIEDGVNGFLANSESEWVDKLSLLIENESLRKSMGEKGRQTVEEKYSVHAYQYQYLSYFDKLTSH